MDKRKEIGKSYKSGFARSIINSVLALLRQKSDNSRMKNSDLVVRKKEANPIRNRAQMMSRAIRHSAPTPSKKAALAIKSLAKQSRKDLAKTEDKKISPRKNKILSTTG